VSRRIPPALPGHDKQIGFAQATVNRNKRNLTLDLRKPEGREIFLKLAARSDIIVQNFRPGTFAKWGIGYDDVRAVKPDIIYVSISGYGQFGPIHDRVAYDPLAQAMSGFVSLGGSPDGAPTKAPTWLCDDLGGLHGAIGALAALRHRDRTGEGQHIDVAMLDAMLFQSNGYLTLAAMNLDLKRWGNEIPFSVPTNTYQCRDGLVMAGVLLDTHWKVIARMAGREDLANDPDYATIPGRMNHRDECNAMVAKWCAERTVDEAVEACAKQGIPCAKVRTYAEAARCPHTHERDMLQQVAQEDGKLAPITGPAAKFSRTPTRIRTGAAALGAHTDEVLAELGIDANARKRLRTTGVI
jgi:formyl-CoA transferase